MRSDYSENVSYFQCCAEGEFLNDLRTQVTVKSEAYIKIEVILITITMPKT